MNKKSLVSPSKKTLNPLTFKNHSSMNKGKAVSSNHLLQAKHSDAAAAVDSADVSPPSNVDPLELRNFSKLNSRDKFRRVKILADRKIKVLYLNNYYI